MFQLTRGATRNYTAEVRDGAGALVDLSTAAITFTARDNAGVAILTKRNAAAGGSSAEVEVTGPGIVVFKFGHADTERAPVFGSCDAMAIRGTEYLPIVETQAFEILDASTRSLP